MSHALTSLGEHMGLKTGSGDLRGWALLLPLAAAVLTAVSCAGAGDITQPGTGTLEITTSTTGVEPDTDGYIMQMDAERTQALEPTGTFRSADASPGNHIIQLAGVAANCSIAGANPRSVTVSAGATSTVRFEVTCGATSSSLQVSSTTTGTSPDPDGYRISIDGIDQGTLGASDAVTLATVAPGDHLVGLSGVTGSCQVEGDNPREVAFTAGESTAAPFEVSCAAPPPDAGTLRVNTTTAGGDPDANGYVVTLDGEASQPIGLNASITVDNLTSGSHTLELSGLAENCSLEGDNPRSATVTTGITSETNFAITCSASTGTIQVSVTTSGTAIDPDGYEVEVDVGGPRRPVATNGAVTFTGIPSGTRIVQLGDVNANCSVAEGNRRSVTVTIGETSEVEFAVTCEVGTGSIEVTAATRGSSFVTGSFTVAVDGGPATAIEPNGSRTFGGLPPGLHRIELAGLPPNCHTEQPNPWEVTVVAGGGINTVIPISCSSSGGSGLVFSQISAGVSHTCGVTTNSEAYCWGLNTYGGLGDGTTADHWTPVLVAGGFHFQQVSAGAYSTCGVTVEYVAYCWGNGDFGGLGNGYTNNRLTPEPVAGGLQFRQIETLRHTCAVSYPDDKVYCWGYNPEGELGDGTLETHFSPLPISSALHFRQVTVGNSHTCGVTMENAAYCWGENTEGQVGDGSGASFRETPVEVAGGYKFSEVDAGEAYNCGVTTKNEAYCWGNGTYGQTGQGSTNPSFWPRAVVGGLAFSHVTAGARHTCGTTTLNQGYCWGFAEYGQLGDGTGIDTQEPVAVAGGLFFGQLSAGGFHTCGYAPEGLAYCWGDNWAGQVGDGTTEPRLTPVVVAPAQ